MAETDEELRTARMSLASRLRATAGGAPLLILYHRDGVRAVPLEHEVPLIVGREEPADVVVNDSSLSRQHARFTWNGKEVKVEDLGSTNGTWFGEEPVETTTVQIGQELTLGAVMAAIQSPAGAATTELGLDSHDRFMALLQAEIVRAKFFARPLSVAMIRALQPSARHLRHWAPSLRALLRPVDRAALYSPEVLEIVLQELDTEQARELLEKLLDQTERAHELVVGLSTFPSSAVSAERLLDTARTALLRANASERVRAASAETARTLEHIHMPSDVVSESPAMRRALDLAQRLARGVIPVLLQGETGSGKEVLARFIHESGPRRDKPLVAVNSAAIPAQLLESTLFGHEKGAFTGATQRQPGVFEAAQGGSVFLDEIGELPLEAQASLLRVLETKSVTRVGSTKEIPIDARILAASHRDLEALVAEGRFRQDLFYRLNAITLPIPPLRERREDIAPLARHFLQLANAANGTNVASIDEDALDALQHHHWPGNVRELRNAIERGVVIAEHATLTLQDLPEALRGHLPRTISAPAAAQEGNRCRPGEDFRACMERIEAEVLVAALEDAEWNKSETARRLGMPRRTLVHKVRVYRIKSPSSTE